MHLSSTSTHRCLSLALLNVGSHRYIRLSLLDVGIHRCLRLLQSGCEEHPLLELIEAVTSPSFRKRVVPLPALNHLLSDKGEHPESPAVARVRVEHSAESIHLIASISRTLGDFDRLLSNRR